MLTQRKLGQQGLEVSALGLGCMGLTWAYGPTNEAESRHVLQRAFDLGVNFWDTAEVYGPYNNEELISRALRTLPRQKIIIATKFGFKISRDNIINGVDSTPEHIRKSIEGSLKRLGTDYIDLYYQHRLDPKTPIEDVMQVLAGFVKAGKIKTIGLSEVGASIIRRAHAIYPLTAVQSEYSLWERDVENDILPTLNELGIGFVPYSPLGRGFLTGKIHNANDLDDSDWRQKNFLRIQGENLEYNFALVKKLQEIANQHGATPAQVALAWLLRQGEDMVPIPGTKHVSYLEENVQAIHLALPEATWNALDTFINSFTTAGPRYSESNMQLIHRD